MGLSQLYSSIFLKIIKFKKTLPKELLTSVKSEGLARASKNQYGETEVQKICQKQKILSENEMKEVVELYMNGVPWTFSSVLSCVPLSAASCGINITLTKR